VLKRWTNLVLLSLKLGVHAPQMDGPLTLGTWQNEQQAALEIDQFIEGKTR
jgi:hypothetical protein